MHSQAFDGKIFCGCTLGWFGNGALNTEGAVEIIDGGDGANDVPLVGGRQAGVVDVSGAYRTKRGGVDWVDRANDDATTPSEGGRDLSALD
jgi:hypothetical protein